MPIAKSVKFNFKTRKIADESGKEIGRTKKQPSIECDLPVLAADEIVASLNAGGPVALMIQEAVARIVYDAARTQFDDIIESFGDEDKEVSANMLDFDKLSLEYIASIPAASRGATAISEEEWEAFFTDYLAVMVAATGKDESRINNHIGLFKKPTKAKANKEVLAVLIDQLDIYMASSGNLEDTGACASRIRDKFCKWHAEPEKAPNLDLL